MNGARCFITLLTVAASLSACAQAPTPIPTVTPPPQSTIPVSPPSSTLTPTATPSPPPALAPPGGVTQPVPISPTGAEGASPSPLAAILESYRASLTSGATMILLEAVQPEPIPFQYTSELRPLAPETHGFLWQFGQSFGQEELADSFEHELLIREGDQDHWMPVQESLLQRMMQELAAGETATLHVRLLGSLETEQGYRPIFIIAGFQK